jgi:Trk K+ transport system NAD-binding subunit
MPSTPGALSDHVIVCGLDHLGRRTIKELRLGDMAVIGIAGADDAAAATERSPDLTVVVGDPRRDSVLRAASIETATAIVLTGEDDQANVSVALAAQEMNPTIRIVLRMFDPELGNHIEALIPTAVALSSSALAAPGFVSAALDGDAGASFVLAGHRVVTRLVAARDTSAGGADSGADLLATIPIARLRPDRTVDLLPAGAPDASDAGAADLLVVDVARTYRPEDRRQGILDLARHATGTVMSDVSEVVSGVGGGIRGLPSRVRGGFRAPRIRAERRIVRFGGALIALAIISALYFQVTAGLSPLDAFSYAVTLLTGAALPTSLDPTAVGVALKVYAIGLSVVGAAIVAVVYALITDAIVRSRLLQTLGRRSVPAAITDHVIVAGLGSIGHRVALDVAARGVPVVVADIDEEGRFTASTRASGIPVVVGDARHPEILADLGIERARAVIAATSDDLVNIAVALNARAVRPDLRVVVRVFDPDFALRVQRGFRIRFTRSVSHLAAPAFAAAAIGSEVIATVPVGDRRVLLFARVPVAAGSALDGASALSFDEVETRRVLAIDGPDDDDARWLPAPGDAPAPGDSLIVAATRAGLARLLERARATGDAG